MITASTQTRQPPAPASWQRQLASAITDPHELLRLLELDPALADSHSALAAAGFQLRVPRGFVQRMRRGDPNDPLLLQVLPGARELIESPGFAVRPARASAAPCARRGCCRSTPVVHC